MAVTFLGLTIGDDGTGFRMPTYDQFRAVMAKNIRQLRRPSVHHHGLTRCC